VMKWTPQQVRGDMWQVRGNNMIRFVVLARVYEIRVVSP